MDYTPYEEFAKEKLGFAFNDINLLVVALTHRSYVNEHKAAHEHNEFSTVGRGTARPNWEMIVAHYGKSLGMPCLYSETFANKLRPECGAGDARYGMNSGAFDQVGWSTLMLYTE